MIVRFKGPRLKGRAAQTVTCRRCRIADTCMTADPDAAGSFPAFILSILSRRFDHEIISTAIHVLPSTDSRRVVVSSKRNYVHEILASLPRRKSVVR